MKNIYLLTLLTVIVIASNLNAQDVWRGMTRDSVLKSLGNCRRDTETEAHYKKVYYNDTKMPMIFDGAILNNVIGRYEIFLVNDTVSYYNWASTGRDFWGEAHLEALSFLISTIKRLGNPSFNDGIANYYWSKVNYQGKESDFSLTYTDVILIFDSQPPGTYQK